MTEMPDDAVWCCDCGCSNFKLLYDDRIVCAQCGAPANDLAGGFSDFEDDKRIVRLS